MTFSKASEWSEEFWICRISLAQMLLYASYKKQCIHFLKQSRYPWLFLQKFCLCDYSLTTHLSDLKTLLWNQDMFTPIRNAERTIYMIGKTSFLCFTDNPKTLSQLSERHIKTYLKELSYKMSSSWEVHKVWIDIKSSKTLWQIARHDNFSQVKKQKSISFSFPSAISKGTANIHCVISST